jgi:hypothetical protein
MFCDTLCFSSYLLVFPVAFYTCFCTVLCAAFLLMHWKGMQEITIPCESSGSHCSQYEYDGRLGYCAM